MANTQFMTGMYLVCGCIYDENSGIPADGIAPGSRWEDLPPDRACPDCEGGKDDFNRVGI